MIHDIPKLRIFPLWRIWVHIIVTCTEDGNIQGMRGVRKHSYIQQEEQNLRQPSRVALNRKQQYSSIRHKVIPGMQIPMHCARVAYALLRKSSDYVSYSSRFISRQKNAASFLLVPHVQR